MQAAAEVFARKGYHSTTVSEIAQSQGVSKGVLYWYFPSKEELFAEILREAVSGLRRAQAQALDGIQDPLERIAVATASSLRFVHRHMAMFSVFEEALTSGRFREVVRAGHKKLVEDTVEQLRAGFAAGTVRNGDPEMMAQAIFGTMSYVARFLLPNATDAEAVVAEAVRFCVAGVAVSETAARRALAAAGLLPQ